jgi:hypothetical protein
LQAAVFGQIGGDVAQRWIGMRDWRGSGSK